MVKTSLADIRVLFTGRDSNCQNKANTFLLGLTCVLIPEVSHSVLQLWGDLVLECSPQLVILHPFFPRMLRQKLYTRVTTAERRFWNIYARKTWQSKGTKRSLWHWIYDFFLALYFYVHITGSSWNNFGKIYTVYKSILQCNISNTWRTASFDIMVQFRFKNYFSIRLNFVTVDICLILVFAKYVSVY